MIFTSFAYAGFLAALLVVYWLLPRAARPAVLLAASAIFYATWSRPAVAILAATSVMAWGTGLLLPRLQGRRRDVLTGAAVLASVGALLSFKLIDVFDTNDNLLRVAIPVGLSFFSFQAISYVVDVRRGHLVPRRSLLDVALYLSFFPHLLAGPIVRADKLIPAFHDTRRWPDRTQSSEALELLVVGTFKKVALADPIFAAATTGGSTLTLQGTPMLLVTLFGLLVAAYFDVTGYIDIARGSAKLLGIDMQRNSLTPLLSSTGYADFWRRWQLTIMMWFRDYVFLPLRGDGSSRRRNDAAMFATFLALGAWHGLDPGWLLWGVASGVVIVVEQELQHRRAARRRAKRRAARRAHDRNLLPSPPSDARRLAITVVLVLLTLPIAAGFAASRTVYGALLRPRWGQFDGQLMTLVAVAVAALVLLDRRERRREALAGTPDPPGWGRAIGLALAVLAIVILAGPTPRSFLYFQF